MAVTYNSLLLTDKDRVRFLVQDTDVAAAALQDEEILWVIAGQTNVRLAAADCCDILAARYAAQAQVKRVGQFSIDTTVKAKVYADRAADLRRRVTGSAVPVPICTAYAGGISLGDKEEGAANTMNVQPLFQRDQFL